MRLRSTDFLVLVQKPIGIGIHRAGILTRRGPAVCYPGGGDVRWIPGLA